MNASTLVPASSRFESHPRQLPGKVTALGVLCCFALFVCSTLLASFFLPSHISFKNMYICTCTYPVYAYMVSELNFLVHVHVHVHVYTHVHVAFTESIILYVHVCMHVRCIMFVQLSGLHTSIPIKLVCVI